MKRGRWESSSVFVKYYKKSKVTQFSSEEIQRARTASENAADASSDARSELPPQPILPSDPPVQPPEEASSPPARLHDRDSSGKPLHIPGTQRDPVDGNVKHCSMCWKPDDNTMFWCKRCNAHFHRLHFGFGRQWRRAEEQFLKEGFTCESCIKQT